jgi:two-component sensor histidine kinase
MGQGTVHPRVRAIYRIDAEDDGPARARAIVDRELGTVVTRRMLEELELMVSELVTNGIKFGTRDRHETLTLNLCIDARIRCEVISPGPPFLAGEALRRHRWGLKMVAALADRWGVERVSEGTQVWFETGPTGGSPGPASGSTAGPRHGRPALH